jgi:hypothetical protein
VKAPATVEQFTVAALERLGGAVEEQAPGLFTALWPVPGKTDVATRQLAFDPEVLDEAPAAELVTFASPTLEEIVRLAAASGRVARAFLNAVVPPSRRTAELLARSYRFTECAWSAATARPWWTPAGVFLFRARYLSDAREEELLEVALGLAELRILRRLPEAIERHGVVADTPEAWPMQAEARPAEAYAAARAELECRLVAPLGLRRRELASRLAREASRATAYFDELYREAEEQQSRLSGDAPERATLTSKLTAIRREREGRIAELQRKYRLEAEVALLSVLRLYLPRLVFRGRLTGKRDAAALTLVWDPVEQAGEPISCGRCRTQTYEASLSRGVVACPACLGGPPGARGPR